MVAGQKHGWHCLEGHLAVAIHDEVGESLQRGTVGLAVEGRTGAGRVLDGEGARGVNGAGRGHSLERAVILLAGERPADALVLAGGEDQRQRRRAVAQIDAGGLPGRVEVARAVEDVVGDLEGDAERKAEVAELGARPAEDARGLEELSRLEGAARKVLVDGCLRPEGLPPLKGLATRERERRLGQEGHALGVAGARELRERAGEAHDVIYDRVWGYDFGPASNGLRVYVGYLRRKLEEAGSRPLIHTVRGVGYVLREP